MSDSDCAEVLEKIYLLLDGELSPERCAELKVHLERCAECYGRHETERLFKDLVRRRCGCESAPPQLVARIRFALHAEAVKSD
jgi:mycothiol system anti-sigma-R factor